MFYVLVILAVMSRLLPHPDNFACIGALSLFAGAYLRGRIAFFIPLLARLVSDVAIGFYDPVVMGSVYIGSTLGVVLGMLFLRQSKTGTKLATVALVNASAFFVISNFGCWLSGMYPPTWEGLLTCYDKALPFFRNTLLSDLSYSTVLFGSYEVIRHWMGQRWMGWETL